ncbi:GNAT family N-acetyltransferase [Sansalvadorimonas sp. 2012CJ34-2]|uniref:GNAT family N-acetyltransferase n=1 Tax=Parendozoicomonas callyspongiae TaxID=2942213 RepID=A0ABT0PDD3_9GAMM|nr:GNAT family N-acetyltransferase [Sansalvadorimonas sp. 2012CJ34-2]MCL6269370.1 GNAT family N-acetyltransferase [Sansalvadorimonas sp. 2012CJ34-2]
MNLEFHQVTDERLGLVNRFYKANGHKGKCSREDLVFTAQNKSKIAGAVRYIPKADGFLLRGLWVDEQLRGNRIGYQLLQFSVKHLHAKIWCYPYQHLIGFYNSCSFVEVEAGDVPTVIGDPWHSYQRRGETFGLMQYMP